MRAVSKELLIETIAELLHKTWISWFVPLCENKKISSDLQEAWKDYQRIYFELSEAQKAFYRDEAKKYVRALEHLGIV